MEKEIPVVTIIRLEAAARVLDNALSYVERHRLGQPEPEPFYNYGYISMQPRVQLKASEIIERAMENVIDEATAFKRNMSKRADGWYTPYKSSADTLFLEE